MAMAARNRRYVDPYHSADSGYGSTVLSRAPSEQGNWPDTARPNLLSGSNSFLPEMSLSDDLAREPAWSEASFGGDESAATTPKAIETLLQNNRDYFSSFDPTNDSRLARPIKKSSLKQTRFEWSPARTDTTQEERKHEWKESKASPRSNYLLEPVEGQRPNSSALPQSQPENAQPVSYSTQAPGSYDEPRPMFPTPVRNSTPPPQRLPEPQPQFSVPARLSTPPPSRDRHDSNSSLRFSLPPSREQLIPFTPLKCIISGRSSIASLGSLEGFKVNRRRKILDEEGEVIGELVDGDIMDCVRQQVNAYGEVLDDHGRVVGRVQTLGQSMESPIMRVITPAPMQHQQRYPAPKALQSTQQTPLSPATQRQPRRQYGASQPDVFTPAWQRQSHNNHSSLARELRDHLNSAPPPNSQAPLDVTGSVTAVELDGSDRRSEEEETLPLFDHSDIFMPTPVVPPRSPRRSKTPSPPADEGRRTSHQPQSTARSQFLSPTEAAESSLETQQQKQSRHKSAPLGNRYRLPQAQPAQQSVTSWAAAALIEQPNEPQEPKLLSVRTWTESAGTHTRAQAPEEPTYSRGHAPAEPTYKQTPIPSTLYRESPAITQTASQDFASVSRYSRDSARVAGHDRAPAQAKGTSQPKSQYYLLAARDSRAQEPLENTYEQAQAFSQLDSQESPPASRYNQPQEASYHRAKAPVESAYSQCAAPAHTETLDFASASRYKREHKPTVTSDHVPAQVFAIPPAVGPALGQAFSAASAPQVHVQQMQQQQTVVVQQQEEPGQSRRGFLRFPIDSSMSDVSKSYLRPTMSPVSETSNFVEEQDSWRSPAFGYKGDIPTTEGPLSNARLAPNRANGVKSPPLPSFPRQAFNGGLPSASPFTPRNSAQFSSAGVLGPRSNLAPRQFTTGLPGPRPIPQFRSKNLYNAPPKCCPLSSHGSYLSTITASDAGTADENTEIKPPDSDTGSDDAENSAGENRVGIANGMHSHQRSLRSMGSMQSTASKPRTYFTHRGRARVDAHGPLRAQQAAPEKQPVKEPAPSVMSKNEKKGRFSIGFGKKK
ncbi:hypothetical protein LTR86_011244 [Recurvomyces mirabilis]|nr:hypothetical protein LTR86_011244 [Recurvomyces mirabilis]